MNKKGQEGVGFGSILIVFMAIIVGVVLFQVIAQEVGNSTNTIEVVNESLTVAVNDTAQFLNYRALSSVVVINATDATGLSTDNASVLGSGNYTVANNVINPTSGALAVSITPTATEAYKSVWRVSATAQPTTYIAESGGRAMAALIVIFFALAIAVVALEPTLRGKILESMGR